MRPGAVVAFSGAGGSMAGTSDTHDSFWDAFPGLLIVLEVIVEPSGPDEGHPSTNFAENRHEILVNGIQEASKGIPPFPIGFGDGIASPKGATKRGNCCWAASSNQTF